jgi:hypothetical protein
MTNTRVTPQGQAMGKIAARLSAFGANRLIAEGLENLGLPMLRDDMCKSCACRLGTVPNGCPQTQIDLLKSAVEGKPFLCHAPKDGRMCAGWVRMRAAFVAKPLPVEAQNLIAKWEYSAAD